MIHEALRGCATQCGANESSLHRKDTMAMYTSTRGDQVTSTELKFLTLGSVKREKITVTLDGLTHTRRCVMHVRAVWRLFNNWYQQECRDEKNSSSLFCSLNAAVKPHMPQLPHPARGRGTWLDRVRRGGPIKYSRLLRGPNVERLVAGATGFTRLPLIASLSCLCDPYVGREPFVTTQAALEPTRPLC